MFLHTITLVTQFGCSDDKKTLKNRCLVKNLTSALASARDLRAGAIRLKMHAYDFRSLTLMITATLDDLD